MRNFDEALLRSGRPDPAAPFPPVFQVLRLALYGEFAARAFHLRVAEAFPGRAPFAAVAQAVGGRIVQLEKLCVRYGVPRPSDPFEHETTIAPAWRVNLERAVAGELATAQRYAQLAGGAVPGDVANVFARLQRDSLQRQLPGFRDALARAIETETLHARHGVPAEEAYMQHGPLSDFMEKAFSVLAGQHRALGFVAPLLRANPALLGGVMAGSAGVWLARKRYAKTGVRKNGKES